MTINALALASFQDLLPIQSIQWSREDRDQWSGTGGGGALTYDMGGRLWSGVVTIDKMTRPEARIAYARIFDLEGPMNRFLFTNPLAPAPKYDPTGATLGASVVTIDSIDADGRRLKFAGLPDLYELHWGDMWSVDFGSPTLRALFSISADVAADGTHKTPLFRSTPALWNGITAGMTVNLIRPSCAAFIMPGTLQVGAIRNGMVEGASFKIMQVLS